MKNFRYLESITKQDARGPAGYFPPQISSKKTTGQQICSLLILFNIPIYEVCRNFGNFIIFGVIFLFEKTHSSP